MTITILHLRDTNEIGGPGKTIFETINTIDKSKFKIHVAVFKSWAKNETTPFIEEAKRRGYNLHLIKSLNQFDPSILINTLFLVKRLDVNIIHSHEFLSNFIGICIGRITNKPIITTLHGWINNSLKDKVYIKIDKKIIKRFDKVIAVSDVMRRQLQNDGVCRNNISVLHNCIKTENYQKHCKKGYLDELMGIQFKRPIIATIGRLSAEKGHKDFIDAANLVLKKGHTASFVLIGDGPEREILQKKIDKLKLNNNVKILGYLNEIQKVYYDLDLMILPSYTEGLPNVILEALSMEVPVIATNVGGVPEIIKDKKYGNLISSKNPNEMAVMIINFLNKPKLFKHMSKSGKKMVKKKFDFNKRTKSLEKIYEELTYKRISYK